MNLEVTFTWIPVYRPFIIIMDLCINKLKLQILLKGKKFCYPTAIIFFHVLNFETLRQTKYLCHFSLCIKSTAFLLVDFLLSFSDTMIFRVKKNSWWLILHSFFFFTGTLIYDIKWNSKEKILHFFFQFFFGSLLFAIPVRILCILSLPHREYRKREDPPLTDS